MKKRMMHQKKDAQVRERSDQLGKSFSPIFLERFDKRLVRGQRAQCPAHMGVNNLQAVDVAGIDPTESVSSHTTCQSKPSSLTVR
jgi:hypothetical protein